MYIFQKVRTLKAELPSLLPFSPRCVVQTKCGEVDESSIDDWVGGRPSTLGTPPWPVPPTGKSRDPGQPGKRLRVPLWRLYLRCSVRELAQATYININKACCWGPPVRGCHRRGQRRDASALTSRLISLSVLPTKKVGISAQSGIAFGSLSLLHDYWTLSSMLRLLFSSYSATFPKGGNPRGLKTATHRIWVSLILVTPLVISCHCSDFCVYMSEWNLSICQFLWIVTKVCKVCVHRVLGDSFSQTNKFSTLPPVKTKTEMHEKYPKLIRPHPKSLGPEQTQWKNTGSSMILHQLMNNNGQRIKE